MGDDRPLLVVVGNCQAESYRLLLDAGDVRTQRIPALHELTPADVPPLLELLSRTALLVSQPTVDDYRGLPVGTRQLHAALPPSARTALVPSLRYAGLHPFHLLVHPPGLDRPDPPLVPYHDVRTVLAADDERQGRASPRFDQPDGRGRPRRRPGVRRRAQEARGPPRHRRRQRPLPVPPPTRCGPSTIPATPCWCP